jgi:hypothetical protein
VSPQSHQDDLTLPVSRFSRTIGWNVCGATFQLGPKSGMNGPWIANNSAIFYLSERLAYLPQIAMLPHPVAGNSLPHPVLPTSTLPALPE